MMQDIRRLDPRTDDATRHGLIHGDIHLRTCGWPKTARRPSLTWSGCGSRPHATLTRVSPRPPVLCFLDQFHDLGERSVRPHLGGLTWAARQFYEVNAETTYVAGLDVTAALRAEHSRLRDRP